MKTSALREKYTKQLSSLKGKLSNHQLYAVAISAGISETSVRNYLNGEVKNIETAEAIIDAAENELENVLETNED